jgi:hypothetical protein
VGDGAFDGCAKLKKIIGPFRVRRMIKH